MPTPTYIPLQTITLGSAASSVTFASIPQTYRDLVLVTSTKHSFAGSDGVRDNALNFNSDTSSTYSAVLMQGNGSSVTSASQSATNIELLYGMASSNFLPGVISVMDYSATDKHKSILYRAGVGSDSNYGAYALAGRWPSNAAVTSLSITPSGSYTILSGSTFSLYAIEA